MGCGLSAVHHLIDDSPRHILAEPAITVQTRFAERHVHLHPRKRKQRRIASRARCARASATLCGSME